MGDSGGSTSQSVADGLTFQDVNIGSEIIVAGGSQLTLRDSSADVVAIDGATDSLLANDWIGTLIISGGAAETDVEENTIGGGGVLIDERDTGLTLHDNRDRALGASDGIAIQSASDGTITSTDVSAAAAALVISATFTGPITDNSFDGLAFVGVAYGAAADLAGNRIYGNATGIVDNVIDIASCARFRELGLAQPDLR